MISKAIKNIFAVGIIAVTAFSCTQTKEIKPTIIEGETTGAAQASATGAPIADATITTPQAQNIAPMVGGSGLNPAHGQPGHRCDISVGAPLNSPPGNTAASAPQQSIQAPVSAPAAASAPVANPLNLAVNPAHGERGHSCAISVGAPFK